MKYFSYIFTVLILVLGLSVANAQQQAMYTQYMFNGLALNPAYAGSHETLSLTALIREQWVNIEGAPSTQTFSIHAPIRKKKIALGMLLLNDQIGVISQTGVYSSYAYKVNFPNKTILSMGISGGFSYYNAGIGQVLPNDPSFSNGTISEFHPNVGLGFYFHSDRFYVGLSSPQILETTFNRSVADSDSKFKRHYFFTAGKVFDISEDIKLKPSLLYKVVTGAPTELDLNLSVLLQDMIWVGVSYRSFDSFDAILQLQLTPAFQLGYSYDFITTSALNRVNGGSHEIMLNYRISYKKSRIITPRYF